MQTPSSPSAGCSAGGGRAVFSRSAWLPFAFRPIWCIIHPLPARAGSCSCERGVHAFLADGPAAEKEPSSSRLAPPRFGGPARRLTRAAVLYAALGLSALGLTGGFGKEAKASIVPFASVSDIEALTGRSPTSVSYETTVEPGSQLTGILDSIENKGLLVAYEIVPGSALLLGALENNPSDIFSNPDYFAGYINRQEGGYAGLSTGDVLAGNVNGGFWFFYDSAGDGLKTTLNTSTGIINIPSGDALYLFTEIVNMDGFPATQTSAQIEKVRILPEPSASALILVGLVATALRRRAGRAARMGP